MSEHYKREKTAGGVCDCGFEYQIWDGKWRNPTEAGWYLWSGLGDRQSYGFFIPQGKAVECLPPGLVAEVTAAALRKCSRDLMQGYEDEGIETWLIDPDDIEAYARRIEQEAGK